MVLEGLTIDVKGELIQFLVEIDSGFNAAIFFINECDREYRSDISEGNSGFVVVSLVEGDFDCLILGKMLDNQHVLFPFNEEVKGVGSEKTSTGCRQNLIRQKSIRFLRGLKCNDLIDHLIYT